MRPTNALILGTAIGFAVGLILALAWLGGASTASPPMAPSTLVSWPSPIVSAALTPTPGLAIVLIATMTPYPTMTPDPEQEMMLTPHVSMSTPQPTLPPGVAPTSNPMPGQSSR